jgi:hypothetical protein
MRALRSGGVCGGVCAGTGTGTCTGDSTSTCQRQGLLQQRHGLCITGDRFGRVLVLQILLPRECLCGSDCGRTIGGHGHEGVLVLLVLLVLVSHPGQLLLVHMHRVLLLQMHHLLSLPEKPQV